MDRVFSGAKYYIPFAPAIDGELLTRQPIVGAAEGKAGKPVMLGTNRNEAVLFVGAKPVSPADYSAWAASMFGDAFQEVVARYPVQSSSSSSALWAKVQTEDFLICSTRRVAATGERSEERRGGKECVSTCESGGW